MQEHHRVADIVDQVGPNWQIEENLSEVAQQMDLAGLKVEKRLQKKGDRTWVDKLDADPVNFVKAVEYRIKKAKN